MSKHKILVPVDGSDFSRQVFHQIREYLPSAENELTLIRVSVSPHGHVGRPARPAAPESKVPMYESRTDAVEAQHPIYASQEQASAAADLKRKLLVDAHSLEADGYTVNTVIRFNGHAGEAIMRYIDSNDVDMVAMTTHGRSGIERLLYGSVAQYLSKHVTVPLMLVRPSAKNGARP